MSKLKDCIEFKLADGMFGNKEILARPQMVHRLHVDREVAADPAAIEEAKGYLREKMWAFFMAIF